MSRLVFVFMALVLAGCAGSDASSEDREVPAQAGAIRGLVVDESIVPLAGATVALGGTDEVEATDENGMFGFGPLDAGTYFLRVVRIGHEEVQTSVVVQEGVEPPVTTIQLPRIPGVSPFHQTMQFDGFYECAFAGWFITDSCDFVVRTVHDETGVGPRNLQNNVNTEFYFLEPTAATLVQEGFFDTSDVPNFRFSIADTPIDNACDCSNAFLETISDTGYGYGRLDRDVTAFPEDEKDFAVRGFIPFQEQATDVAYAFNVPFQIFTTQFHNYQPAEGWNFLEADEFPAPE